MFVVSEVPVVLSSSASVQQITIKEPHYVHWFTKENHYT